MKRKNLMIITALVTGLLFVGILPAQRMFEQSKNLARSSWPQDDWYYFDASGETKNFTTVWFADIVVEDTLWTETYDTWPYLYLEAEVEDTCATDSVVLKVEFWATDSGDTTDFQLIKTLLWHPDDAGTAVNTIVAVDKYWCNVGDTQYPGFTYHRLRIIAYGDHATDTGMRMLIRAQAHAAL